MPIYEYYCPVCTDRFELRRPLSSSAEEAHCPQCQGSSRRMLSTFACFSKSSEGMSTPVAGSGSGCGTCSSSSCSTCGG